MAYTEADLDNIRAALVTGAKSVELEGKKVTFRDQKQLLEMESIIKRALGKAPAIKLYQAIKKG